MSPSVSRAVWPFLSPTGIFNSAGVFQSMFGWGVDTGAAAFEICTSSCHDGISGTGDGQLRFPTGVAVNSSGNIHVAGPFNDRFQIFDSAGVFQSKFGSSGSGDGQFDGLFDIAIDSTRIYVVDHFNSRVQVFGVPPCSPPASGDWTVSSTCTMTGDATADGNVIVPNGVVLTIPNGVTLDINFVTKNLTVQSGGGVLIKAGGKIT